VENKSLPVPYLSNHTFTFTSSSTVLYMSTYLNVVYLVSIIYTLKLYGNHNQMKHGSQQHSLLSFDFHLAISTEENWYQNI